VYIKMNKTHIIRIVLSIGVFFAVLYGLGYLMAFLLEGEVISRAFDKMIIIIILFSNAIIASILFNILFKMRFEK